MLKMATDIIIILTSGGARHHLSVALKISFLSFLGAQQNACKTSKMKIIEQIRDIPTKFDCAVKNKMCH